MQTKTLIASAAVLMFSAGVQAQVIGNGSLTGPTGSSMVPGPWYLWQATPDTVNASGPLNFTGTPWTLSPDGGTFALTAGSTLPNSEGFAQMVSGFTIGQTYQIDFYQTNMGFYDPVALTWNGEDGFYNLIVDGVLTDASSVISKPASPSDSIVWTADSFTFTATSTTHELAFLGRSVNPGGIVAVMGIDGIRLTPIPAPGVLASLGGLALITRRRRN
ncbi:MAG: hypothetical protein AAGB51_09685 [Planctomycetota bacterium]